MNLLNIGVVLQFLALMAWTGGIFALLFVRGGNVFAGVGEAHDIGTRMLRRFSGVEVIAGLVLLTGGGVLYLADVETQYVACNLGLSGLMFAIFIIYGFGIVQRMELIRARLQSDAGEATDEPSQRRLGLLARTCTLLMSINLLLGIAQVVLLVLILSRLAEPPAGDNGTMDLYGGGAFATF